MRKILKLGMSKGKGKSRKRIKRSKEKGCTTNWCNLPQNFIASLLYFLSPKSICAFKAACRPWNEARLLLPVPVGAPSSPCHSSPILIRAELLIPADREKTSYLECYHPMTGEFFRLKTDLVKEHGKDLKVHCSDSGWLLMSKHRSRRCLDRSYFFFDPFTNRQVDHTSGASSLTTCFTSPPTSSDRSRFSGISLEPNIGPFGGSLIITGNCSKLVTTMPEVLSKHEISPHNSLVFHCRSYYCLVGAGVVGVSNDFSEKERSFTFHDTELFECGTKLRHSFLLEVDGKLLGIFDYQGIRVFWLDTDKWIWNPVGDDDLRDKILYVSYKGSYVQCDDTTKGAGNKIYFPTIVDGGGVYYSLDTGKYYTPSCELEEIEDYGDSMTWIAPTVTDSS